MHWGMQAASQAPSVAMSSVAPSVTSHHGQQDPWGNMYTMHVATKLRHATPAAAASTSEVRVAHNTHVSRLVSFRPDEDKMAAAVAEKATYQPP